MEVAASVMRYPVCNPAKAAAVLAGVKYATIVDAIRATAEKNGINVHTTVAFCFTLDEAEQVTSWIRKHSRQELQEKILCLTAEAK